MRTMTMAALGAALTLAGCGGGSATGAASRWNAEDACKTLDRTAVAAATGQTVTAAENTYDMGGGAASGVKVATCSYTLGNAGGSAILMTRVSDTDLTDTEIEQMRDGAGMLPKGEELPGYGVRAYWTGKTRQIQVIVDRHHYFSIVYGRALTLPGTPPPAGPDPKKVVTGLARTLL